MIQEVVQAEGMKYDGGCSALCAWQLARLELKIKPLGPKSQAQLGEVKAQLLLHVMCDLSAKGKHTSHHAVAQPKQGQIVVRYSPFVSPFPKLRCRGLTPETSKGPLNARAAICPKYVPFSISHVFESQRCRADTH